MKNLNSSLTFVAFLATAVGIGMFCGRPRNAVAQTASYDWKSVRMGGGGYVTGLYPHPAQTDLMYVRSDVGGIFRWDAAGDKWIPLLDKFATRWNNQPDYFKVESVAISALNTNTLYAAVGKYADDWWTPGALLKSDDRGANWRVVSPANWGVKVGGAGNIKHWGGERLMVSPHDANIVLYGSRRFGLWRSTDGGTNWARVDFGTPTDMYGYSALAFNPWTAGSVYCSVWGDGVYKSSDNGAIWSRITGSPTQVVRMKIGWGGIFATTTTGVFRGWGSGTWTDITPPGQAGNSFCGLDTKDDKVVVSAGEQGNAPLFYANSGSGTVTWTQKNISYNRNIGWWQSYGLKADWTAAIAFEPWRDNALLLTHWFGVERTADVSAVSPVFTERVTNLENMVAMNALCPPAGTEFLSAVADIGGFRHSVGLDAVPIPFGTDNTARPANPAYQDTLSLAYCETVPQTLYRTGGNRYAIAGTTYQGVAKSTNGGVSWTEVKQWINTDETGIPWRIAVARNNANKLVLIRTNSTAQYSTNGGTVWSNVSGLPVGPEKRWNWSQPLTVDSVRPDTFYYYNGGTVYCSVNGGQSFVEATTGLPSENFAMLKAMPGGGGEVWLSARFNGLYRGTTNSGGTLSFAKVANVINAEAVALGKPQVSGGVATLFIYGGVRRGTTDEYGVFRSVDRGANWIRVDDPLVNALGNIGKSNDNFVFEASRQTFGRIFVGTDGRGFFYGSPK